MTVRMLACLAALAVCGAAAEPIHLHPGNPRYFLYRGRTIALVTSAEHYGAVLNAAFDYEKYLDALAADGLNYTRLFGGSYVEVPATSFGIRRNTLAPEPGRFVAPWARSSTPGYQGGGNQFDLAQWNPEYFTRFRKFLSEAQRRGIVVEVTLFSSHYQQMQWHRSPFHPSNNVNATDAIEWKNLHTPDNGNILAWQEKYTRKLVREANPFDNVIFEIQNEPWSDRSVLADVVNPYLPRPARDQYPNSIDLADQRSLAWQALVSSWISGEEAALPHRHLIAQNYCNFALPVRELAPGVAIVNFHYAYPAAVTANAGLGTALVYDETGFLGPDDAAYRRQAWNFMLSGGSGFNNLDYSFSPGHEDGADSEPNGPGGGSAALRRQLGVLARFLHSLPLEDTAPDTHLVAHAGAWARALSASGRDFGIYFDGDGPVDVTLNLLAGRYSGQWIDTETGAVKRDERFTHAGGRRPLHSPPFRHGIALRLKRD